MPIKRLRIVSTFWLVLLVACSATPDQNNTFPAPTEEIESQLTASTEPDQAAASPSSSPKLTPTIGSTWDDRSIFAPNLGQSGQQSLNALPQASVYHISLEIPEDLTELLPGSLTVRYFNTESNSLGDIYFRLYPNYYGGKLDVQNVMVDGQPAATEMESKETALRVNLAEPLNPGRSVEISMEFQLKLPETMGGNYGLLGYFDGILVLDTFYPMIPVYDQDGWSSQFPYPNGDLTYNDASFYLVEVSAPADLVLAASGSVVEESVVDGVQTLTIAAGPARDFYLAGSKTFTVSFQEWNGILVSSYALDGFEIHQESALRYAVQALKTFSELFGPYPYSEFDVISSPMLALGIEYPGITGIFLELYQVGGTTLGVPNESLLESVVAHEVGHQWFYNVVGNDQQRQPWVDESLVQYITYVYFLENYGESAAIGLPLNWQGRLTGIEDTSMPVELPAGAYDSKQYSGFVYGKGPLFFQALEEQIGRQDLWDGIAHYYQAYLWSISDTEAIRTSLETACRCDLSLMFEEWIYPEDS